MEEKNTAAASETTEAKLQKQEKKSVIFIVALSAVLLLGVVWIGMVVVSNMLEKADAKRMAPQGV